MISIISDIGIEIVNALQISKLKFEKNVSNFARNDYRELYDWGTGFYLLHGQKDSFFSINEYSQSTSSLVKNATKLVYQPSQLPEPQYTDEVSSREIVIDISDEGPWTHDYKSEIENLTNFITSILQDHPRIKYWIKLEGEIANKMFQSSFSGPITQYYSQGLLTVELYSHNSGDPILLVDTFGGIMNEDFNFNHIEAKILATIKLLDKLESARHVRPGEYPLCLSADTSYSLIHESIGHGTEADQYLTGNSFLSGRIGTKVAATDITIIDDPHVRGAGWSEYDDEGTKTKGTMLVEDGFLIDLLHTKKSARILEENPTGNARASSYITPPEPRQSNIMLEPKDYSLQEQLDMIEGGLLLGPTQHASTSIYSGEIMIETQYGHTVKNGSIEKIVKPITLTGNSLNLLKKVTSVGNQVGKFPTYCLKQSNRIMIGAYSPQLTISSYTI